MKKLIDGYFTYFIMSVYVPVYVPVWPLLPIEQTRLSRLTENRLQQSFVDFDRAIRGV